MSLFEARFDLQFRADITVLIPCFPCFHKFHMPVLKEPASRTGKLEINIFSGSIHFLLPVVLVYWTEILGDLSRGGLCVSRGEHRVKSWRNGGCPESHEKLSGLGGVRVSGSICFKET